MNLLIVGAPGVGKGTMSKFLIEEYGVDHISTGDMLREAVANATPIGLKVKELMDSGSLVPDDIIEEMITDRLSKDGTSKGFLFDGYPRNISQAKSLTKILDKLKLKIDAIIYLEVAEDVLIKRITGRRTCPNCKETYNIYYKLPKVEGVCDSCGSKLIIRKDDNEDSLKNRLSEFHNNTEPVIEYYDKENLIKRINADQSREAEFEDIRKALEGIE